MVSLLTLFSAILYSQEMPCQTDEDCPEGYICQDNYCVHNIFCLGQLYDTYYELSDETCCFFIPGSTGTIKCVFHNYANRPL